MAEAAVSVSSPDLVYSSCETDTQQESSDVVDESYESPKYIHPLRTAMLKAVKEAWVHDCGKIKPGSPPFAISTVESCLHSFLEGRIRIKETTNDKLIARSTLERLGDALVTLFLRHLTDDAGCRGKARMLYTEHMLGSKINCSIKQRKFPFPLSKSLRLCLSVISPYDEIPNADAITRVYAAAEYPASEPNRGKGNSLLDVEAQPDVVSHTIVTAFSTLEIRELD